MIATVSFLNLQSTPIRGLIRSGPVSSVPFKETPWNFEELSKTTLRLSVGFFLLFFGLFVCFFEGGSGRLHDKANTTLFDLQMLKVQALHHPY